MVRGDGLDAAVGGGHERDLAIPRHEQGDEGGCKDSRYRKREQRGNPDRGHPELAPRIGGKVGKERERQGPGQGTKAHRCQQESEAVRADAQDLVGEQWHQGRAVHREHGNDDQQRSDHGFASRVGRSLCDPPEHGLLLAPWSRWWEVSHQQQGGDRGQVAHGVEQEADRHADDGDEHARNGWSDDCRSVEDRRVERDRVQEVVLADHVDLERLPRRNVECVDGACRHRGKDNHPVLRVARLGQRKQDKRRHHEGRLRE